MKGYFRVRDHGHLPSLKDTDLMMTNGPYTEVKADAPSWLTLIPPSMIGPPEFVHLDMKDTDKPGLVMASRGAGSVAWIPWDLAALVLSRKPAGACRAFSRCDGQSESAAAVGNDGPSARRDYLDEAGWATAIAFDQPERTFTNRLFPACPNEQR